MTETPHYLAAAIRERLARETNELGIHVDVRSDEVFLRGDVATDRQREAVERVASSAAEGRKICNEVSVVPVREPDGRETLS
jgi:osmotically-inducible protein OsmY